MGYPLATKKDDIYQFSKHKFGSQAISGMQHKGIAVFEDGEYFVKLDTLSPAVSGTLQPHFDVQYSSISEAIVSCFLKHADCSMDSTIYEIGLFEKDNKSITGTRSRNYLDEYEVEYILSSGYTGEQHTTMTRDNYIEKIADVSTDTRIQNLENAMVLEGMERSTARQFLIQQAGFDLLTGNNDRLHNPSNFVMAYNVDTQTTRPINMDYGRCLQIGEIWSNHMEAHYLPEYLDEDTDVFASTMDNDSIISALRDDEQLDYLVDHTFIPFRVDTAGLNIEFENLKKVFLSEKFPCPNFALAKLETFRKRLELPFMKQLWQDTTLTLSEVKGLERQEIL